MINTTVNRITIWILNTILKHNHSSIELLKLHHGKSFTITTIGFNIAAVISDVGLLEPSIIKNEIDINSTEHTVEIHIPLSTLTYIINHDKLDTFKKISFVGDKRFGRNILEILSNVHFTGLYEAQNPIVILSINRVHYLLNMIKSQFALISNNLGHSVAEYIQYETRDIANHYEIDAFCSQVDELKSRTELLIKRIALIKLKNHQKHIINQET